MKILIFWSLNDSLVGFTVDCIVMSFSFICNMANALTLFHFSVHLFIFNL